MSQIKVIEHFFKTFYPEIEFDINIKWEDHFSMSRETNWIYEVFISNVKGLIYNPVDFSPIHTLVGGGTVDLSGVYDSMMNFIPHLVSRVTVSHTNLFGDKCQLPFPELLHRSF